MENFTEPSSSLSFTTSSSYLSNNSSNYLSACSDTTRSSLEIVSLSKLSSNLEQLLSTDCISGYRDAEIIVDNIAVGVHRCILACRSEFFNELFKNKVVEETVENSNKTPKYHMNKFLPFGKVGYEALLIFLSYVYTGKLKPSPPEVSTCVFNPCDHEACRPAIEFAVELMYASSIFKIPELVSLLQRRLLNFVGKARAEDVIPILMVALHCNVSQLVTQCVERIMQSDLDSICLEKELPYEISENIRLLRLKCQTPLPCKGDDDENMEDAADHQRQQDKRIRRIHKALDSDDIELVNLLLSESKITLDEANALHYAVAYCDPKVVSELLGLRMADVNRRNSRGYTVLHMAAMRKEAKIIISLLTEGASVAELTLDGQSAVTICRRLTRPKDYNAKIEQGQESNKDRLCIDVLERELRRKPFDGEALISSPLGADDLHMKLLYFENRVAFARLFFPTEAKVAMDIAHAETTFEFAGLSSMKGSNGTLEREVDLNETPLLWNERLLSRMEALQKTVETGRRYFPHCSEVIDKFMEDDLLDLCDLDRGTPDERRIKTTRFMEVKKDVQQAFSRDKAENSRSGLSSSSCTNSLRYHKNRKL